MEWLFHFNTGTLGKHKLPLTCSVSLSSNILKAFSRSIMGKATPVYSEKISLEVPTAFPLKAYLRSSAKESWQNAPSFNQENVLPNPFFSIENGKIF